jgi:hypothetical protein
VSRKCVPGKVPKNVLKKLLPVIVVLSLTGVVAHAQPQAQTQAPAQTPTQAQTCPDLAPLYAQTPEASRDEWETMLSQLRVLLPRCLDQSDYFALLGAAQLNTGRLGEALESLERALLLDPNNGAAQIDYAEALFVQGQLFSALDMNQMIISRGDVPESLRPFLQQRQRSWQSLTRQRGLLAEALVGYDDNLNGAPSPSQITLTLSGDSIQLPLSEAFRPIAGPYLNLRLAGRYRQLAPEHQHNMLVEMRGRLSEDTASDLFQLDTRYAFIKPGREHSWQAGGGINHLFFGGSPLYTATEVSARYAPVSQRSCTSSVHGAAQHQLFHNQSTLNTVEAKAGLGLGCPLGDPAQARQLVSVELSALTSRPIKSGRPGGSREGWQLSMDWQLPVYNGSLNTQLSHTELRDSRSYSPLLADGASRRIQRSYVLLQYRQPLRTNTLLLFNLYRQHQDSNIDLFRSTDSSVEIGISHSF